MSDAAIDFVLFDLGGVLIELGDVSSLQELTVSVGSEDQWQRWLSSAWVRRFERGECSASEFSAGMVSDWGLEIAPERFLEIFRDWPVGPYPHAAELLAAVQRSVQIGCLSNTNAMHWEHQLSSWPVLEMFDFRFLSFELGVGKPDQAIFQAVADRLPFRKDRILYFDDVAVNADAARSFGFRSETARGLAEVRVKLCEVGLLSP